MNAKKILEKNLNRRNRIQGSAVCSSKWLFNASISCMWIINMNFWKYLYLSPSIGLPTLVMYNFPKLIGHTIIRIFRKYSNMKLLTLFFYAWQKKGTQFSLKVTIANNHYLKFLQPFVQPQITINFWKSSTLLIL